MKRYVFFLFNFPNVFSEVLILILIIVRMNQVVHLQKEHDYYKKWSEQRTQQRTWSSSLCLRFVLLKKICGLCRQLFLFLKIAACVASPRREEDSIDMVYSKWIMPKMAPLFPKCLWPCHHSIPLQAQTLFLQKHHRRAWEGGCWNTLEQVKFLMCLCPTWTLSEYFGTRWNTLAFVPHEHLVNICRCFSSR